MAPSLSQSPLPSDNDKARFVREGFNRIAATYDRVNDLMTFGLHRRWKRRLFEMAGIQPGWRVLDLCCGTGDLAHLASGLAGPHGRATGVDFAADMLRLAPPRCGWPCAGTSGTSPQWSRADVLDLPFPESSFDLVTVGYGLRNVADLSQSLSEVRRVLKPSGVFASLDTCEPRNTLVRMGYRLHAHIVVPTLGGWISGDKAMYRYLPASAAAFARPSELEGALVRTGFHETLVEELLLGVSAIVTARKIGS